MSARIKITIQSNRFKQIAKKARKAVGAIVHKAAFDIEARAKSIVPVDTGMLKNSITTEFPNEISAIVAPHTEYEQYVEFGTRRQRAQPYMRPAAEKVRPAFVAACEKLEESLR